MAYVIFKEDTKAHQEVFVTGRLHRRGTALTEYTTSALNAKRFATAREAYEWAARGDATLQYWKVRRL